IHNAPPPHPRSLAHLPRLSGARRYPRHRAARRRQPPSRRASPSLLLIAPSQIMGPRLTTTPSTSSPPHPGPSHSRARQPNFGAGHYFGRFAQPNYPGNPDPQNTPPPTLVMPNFSVSPGGFGAGASATNATFYLAVFEEYATWDGVPGNRISFSANRVIYNATTTSH
ncbi:hypothetical protein B0H14DRAFT_3012049, partial [Mycena olivaceomarginata]